MSLEFGHFVSFYCTQAVAIALIGVLMAVVGKRK